MQGKKSFLVIAISVLIGMGQSLVFADHHGHDPAHNKTEVEKPATPEGAHTDEGKGGESEIQADSAGLTGETMSSPEAPSHGRHEGSH